MEGAELMGCKDSPAYILDQTMCLYEISKETTREDRAELRRVLLDQEECRERECKTIKTIHQLELPLRGVRQREGCDHPLAERLDGRLYSCDLTHALNEVDLAARVGRGFHGGGFTWTGNGVYATGTLSGITNAGTHRGPAFEPACQECSAPGFMEGRFCGVIRRSADPALLGCQVFGTYRLRFEHVLTDPEVDRNPVTGAVLEGVIVCECSPTEQASAS